MCLPWLNCTDILVEVLGYVGPLGAIKSLMMASSQMNKHIRQDSILWRALCYRFSCPICVSEYLFIEGAAAVIDSEFWYRACRMITASRRLRYQWGINFSTRLLKDGHQHLEGRNGPRRNEAAQMTSVYQPTSILRDSPSTAILPIRDGVLVKLRKAFDIKARNAFKHPLDAKISATQSGDHSFAHDSRHVPLDEMVCLLNRYLHLEYGVLLSNDTAFLHNHDWDHAKQSLNGLILRREVGLSTPMYKLRHELWREVCVNPEVNDRNLPVLSPFLGYEDGAKADARYMVQLMHDAVGGGSPTSSTVRWFFSRLDSLEGNTRYKEVVVAVCFTYLYSGKFPHSSRFGFNIFDARNHSNCPVVNPAYERPLKQKPSFVRVVGVCRRNSRCSWLGTDTLSTVVEEDVISTTEDFARRTELRPTTRNATYNNSRMRHHENHGPIHHGRWVRRHWWAYIMHRFVMWLI